MTSHFPVPQIKADGDGVSAARSGALQADAEVPLLHDCHALRINHAITGEWPGCRLDSISIARVSSQSNKAMRFRISHLSRAALLNPQEHLSIAPQFLQVIVLALVGREEMDNHIPVVEHEPALLGLAFDAAPLLVLLLCGFENSLGKRVQHAVAGAVADHEIIGKGCNVFNVEKQDVLTLLILQGGDDLMSKFECVQISPHVRGGDVGAPTTECITAVSMVQNITSCRPTRWAGGRFCTGAASLLWQCPESQRLSLQAGGGSSVAPWL